MHGMARLARRPGMRMATIEPRVVQLVMARRGTNVPHDRIATTRDHREPDQLVDRPRTDMGRRRVTDVREVKAQQRPQRRRLESLMQTTEPLRPQPIHVDANLPIDIVRSKRTNGHGSPSHHRWRL